MRRRSSLSPGEAAWSGDEAAAGSRHGTTPDLEVVDVPREHSFKVWSHGYPFRTVRWHFHPEYEIHLITETSGRSFIGDYVGTFDPGNLVMTGPNLPHNWISDVEPGVVIPQRCLVLQFTPAFIAALCAALPELRQAAAMLAEAERGIEFSPEIGATARPILKRLLVAGGLERIELFLRLLRLMQRSRRRMLASSGYRARPDSYAGDPINHVLARIARNLGSDLRQSEFAQLSGLSPSAFSRAFERHTGLTFVRYVNELRLNRACELLMSAEASIAEICFAVGFRNLSNFNRQFLARKGMSPSRFRKLQELNMSSAADAKPTGSRVGSRRSASRPPLQIH